MVSRLRGYGHVVLYMDEGDDALKGVWNGTIRERDRYRDWGDRDMWWKEI